MESEFGQVVVICDLSDHNRTIRLTTDRNNPSEQSYYASVVSEYCSQCGSRSYRARFPEVIPNTYHVSHVSENNRDRVSNDIGYVTVYPNKESPVYWRAEG